MQITSRWQGGLAFEAYTESGHTIVTDGGAAVGGQNLGARPMELLLVGMAGCSGIDVVTILQKQRQDVVACEAKVEAERAQEDPKVFTKIHLHFDITGRNLSEDAAAKAVQLSAQKYCSASIMLAKAADVSHSFTVHEAA